MKRLGSLALFSLLIIAGCDNASRLDKATKGAPKAAPSASTPKLDRGGSLEDRVARLEDIHEKNAEALEFLNKVYGQQKQQQQAQERSEPAPDAVFAVDISADIKGGLVEGPAGALVTIVEAWDFA